MRSRHFFFFQVIGVIRSCDLWPGPVDCERNNNLKNSNTNKQTNSVFPQIPFDNFFLFLLKNLASALLDRDRGLDEKLQS